MKRIFTLLVFVLAVVRALPASGGHDSAQAGKVLTVFAAASLSEVVEDLARQFQADTDTEVRLSVASSSVLARQIAAGAEADIYFSANSRWADYVSAEASDDSYRKRSRFCTNSLVVIAPPGSDTTGLSLADAELLALGDPEHVPAGIYAWAALEYLGLQNALVDRLLPCPDVRAALRAVESGDADLGIVYATDVMESDVRTLQTLPPDSHPEIVYELMLLSDPNSNLAADEFYALALGDSGREILTRRGFVPW